MERNFGDFVLRDLQKSPLSSRNKKRTIMAREHDDKAAGGRSNLEAVVSAYLNQILKAAQKLARSDDNVDGDDRMETDGDKGDADDDTNVSADEKIDQIARTLLAACKPETLASGVSHLPELNIFDFDENLDTIHDEEDDEEEEENEPGYYQHRRTDYLRRLLRLMAPISMEVCATVLSVVLSNVKSSADNALDQGISPMQQHHQSQVAAVLLLSHWLAVAPHLMAMAIEFLQNLGDPWTQHTITLLDDDKISLVVAESLYELCVFFQERREVDCVSHLSWDWSFVFRMLHNDGDSTMSDTFTPNEAFDSRVAIRWYAVRILSLLMDWTDGITNTVLEKWKLENDDVPWRIHPWELDQEEVLVERTFCTRQAAIWDDRSIDLTVPSSSDVHTVLRPSTNLARVGEGFCFFREGSLKTIIAKTHHHDPHVDSMERLTNTVPRRSLVPTPTTRRNLSLLAAAMCQDPHPPPILICGPPGSGKSSLVREFLRVCRPAESLMEFHIDEETDSKTLIGTYTTTDIPGEFVWRPGALTHASRDGRWILIEELESVPVEIQAALVKLFEDRMLPIGNGKYERCHPSFQIFATCTIEGSHFLAERVAEKTNLRVQGRRGGGKQILNPSYWRKVHVKSMPFNELREIALSLHPSLPSSIVDSSLTLFSALDKSGREDLTNRDLGEDLDISPVATRWTGGRNPSVRDFFKLFSRISNGMCFEKGASFTTEAQRTLCMAESIDVFMGSCPNRDVRENFVRLVAAPAWNISPNLAVKYDSERNPTVVEGTSHIEIGRVTIDIPRSLGYRPDSSNVFAQTSHALRLLESLASSVRENEPILLVGETGCGKTTLIQHLAHLSGRALVVQNLSLQTDSTDLLGGYRPLEIKNVARHVYLDFVDTFVSTFSRKQNEKFLQYAASMMQKSNWKKLSQCFQRASRLGFEKLERRREDSEVSVSDALLDAWKSFSLKAERFEKQRISCDSGLAFEFAEGALVDAVQSGKW